MLTADQNTLLTQLGTTWPARLRLPNSGDQPIPAGHPLGQEIAALVGGSPASLPFFVANKDEVAWFTLAADVQEMQAAIEDLRAWIIPSFAWEDPRGALVIPGEATGPIGQLILSMSPPGYFRWLSTKANAERVLSKLRQMRSLEEARPTHTIVRFPSLFELRQQFAAALTTGDRLAAEDTVSAIDRRQLDSADNTFFMRVRLLDRFDDFATVVNNPELDRLLALRIPHRVRLAVLRAFHAHYLSPAEVTGDVSSAAAIYSAELHDKLSGTIALCSPADPLPVKRLLGYRAQKLADDRQARELLAEASDEVLSALLAELAKQTEKPEPTVEEAFLEARRKRDWKASQDLGEALLSEHPEYGPILKKSLEFRPNADLHAKLKGLAQKEAPQKAAAEVEKPPPQDWAEWLAALQAGETTGLEAFLEDREEIAPATLGPKDVQLLCNHLEEVFTNPDAHKDARFRSTLLSGLAELLDDFVRESRFPRSELADIYLGLLRLWGSLKRGTAFPPDMQLLLELEEATLQFGKCHESEVIDLIRGWWDARPVKALLPFLLACVELLDRLGTEGQSENLWILAGEFVRGDPEVLTPGERLLWRQIGERIGYDTATLDAYVPLPADVVTADPLRQAALKKIAIVSLREKQTQEAANLIKERCDAEIIVVSETHAGGAMRSALTADVVLFVWSATTHAVFRAFDSMDKKRFAYVQGTGATSILLALERWIRTLDNIRG